MDSFQDLKDKYRFHSQKQLERAKKAQRPSKFSEIAEKSNVKLLALKKALKTKMDEKKKEKYEKRVLMYKIANEEEEADYEKFFDENESECEPNENSQTQPEDAESNDAPQSDKENGNSPDKPEEDDSQQQASQDSDDGERSDEDETNSQSMDCTPGNLIDQNRDMLTRMINKTQQTQLNNEDLLGLCSAKVAVSDFIDDECEDDDDDDDSMAEEADSEDDSNDEEEPESQLNEEESNEAEKREANKEKEDSNSGFDILKDRLKRHRELESDSDDDYSFANKFKFKKTCKIQESEDEEEDDRPADRPNSELSFKNKFISQVAAAEESNSNDNKLSSINGDDLENLNSQDSQFANNRESTFLESRSDVKKTRFNLNDFIEDQAELSEEDKDRVSSDEEEDSNDEYEQEEIDENLPSDEEILKANNKMFMKQQMDEDKRELLEYQERFLEYGDLHDDGEVRQRKFKWKNTDNVWVDNVKESSDSDEFDIDDSQIEYTSMHLKQISEIDKAAGNGQDSQGNEATQSSQASLTKDEKRKKKLMNTSLNKSHLSSYSTFDNSIFNKHMRAFKQNMVSGPANDIKSYIIKDKNLVNAMSVKSSVVVANREKAKQLASARIEAPANKKRKGDKDKNENKKSIFDLF